MEVRPSTASGSLGLLDLGLEVLLDFGDGGDGNGVLLLGLLRLLGNIAALLDNVGEVAGASAVPGEDVLGVAGDVGEGTSGTDGDEVSLELLGGDVGDGVGGVLGGLEREQVGEETSNVGRGHGGTRDGVGGVLRADPGGKNVETRSEDVVALSVVGEVRTLVKEGGSTDGDGLLSSGGRVVARVSVVVTGGHSEVDTVLDGSIDGKIESGRLATTQAHVGSRALEALALAILGLLDLFIVCLDSVLDALDDVGHGARAVGAEHLDGVNLGLLGNTVLLAGNSTRAVSAVTVAILVGIAAGDGLAPVSTALEVNVLVVGTGVNNVDIDALTSVGGIEVLVPCAEAQGVAVGDTGETPGSVLLSLVLVATHGVDDRVLLDVIDLSRDQRLAWFKLCMQGTELRYHVRLRGIAWFSSASSQVAARCGCWDHCQVRDRQPDLRLSNVFRHR